MKQGHKASEGASRQEVAKTWRRNKAWQAKLRGIGGLPVLMAPDGTETLREGVASEGTGGNAARRNSEGGLIS